MTIIVEADGKYKTIAEDDNPLKTKHFRLPITKKPDKSTRFEPLKKRRKNRHFGEILERYLHVGEMRGEMFGEII